MNFKRLLSTKLGIFIISAILGLGLATLFRKACTGKNCITFKGPRVGEIDGKVYQFGDSCMSYHLIPTKCDASKKTLELQSVDPKKKSETKITDHDIHDAFHELGTTTPGITQDTKSRQNEKYLGDFDYTKMFS
jgi:hypothetical protein